jgi:hypothetical protein
MRELAQVLHRQGQDELLLLPFLFHAGRSGGRVLAAALRRMSRAAEIHTTMQCGNYLYSMVGAILMVLENHLDGSFQTIQYVSSELS